jgi:hypothetical protein
MRNLSFTFRRKYDDVANKNEKGEVPKVPYGDHLEEVTSGPNKGEHVPCFLIESDLVPENTNELMEQLESDDNFKQYMDWTFETAILDEIRAYFAKLKTTNPTQETTPEGRSEVIARCKEIGKNFTLSKLFAKAVSATSITESLNSPEMRELAATNPAEFARKTLELLSRVK